MKFKLEFKKIAVCFLAVLGVGFFGDPDRNPRWRKSCHRNRPDGNIPGTCDQFGREVVFRKEEAVRLTGIAFGLMPVIMQIGFVVLFMCPEYGSGRFRIAGFW